LANHEAAKREQTAKNRTVGAAALTGTNEFRPMQIDPDYLMLVLMLALIFLLTSRRPAFVSPVPAIFWRWICWFAFAFEGAYICDAYGWLNRSFPVLVLGFFLVWLLGVTLHNWLAIQAISLSARPLFPKFIANDSGGEWPTHPRLVRLREWLRREGFRPVQAVQADVGAGFRLRVSVYQDAVSALRLQVFFLPHPGGSITLCHSLATNTASGLRYVTDNLCLPFGGFYPENWHVERRPWSRSLPALVDRHRARLQRAGEEPVPWTEPPLDDLNGQQRELERVNTDMGFLFPSGDREEHGKITQAGRYRLWKEYWLLCYFGRSARYE
jgi:hypothetical protein